MVRRYAAKAAAGLLAFLWLAALPVQAAQSAVEAPALPATSEFRVEQTQAKLPALNAWFYTAGASPSEADLSAALGGETLALEELRQAAAADKTQYYFLVDCSTSTTLAQIEAVRAALLNFADNLPAGAQVTLISFGVEVAVLLEGETRPEAIREAAATLTANQPGTLFFDALAKAAELAGQEELALQRKLLFVFSDSVDYNLGGYTKDEVETLLATAGLPLYALGFDTGTKAELDNLGALARASGGGIAVVGPTGLAGALDEFYTLTQNAWMARFSAPGNNTASPLETFTLNLGGQTAEGTASLRFWTPDTEAPTVLSARQQGEDSILLTFSKPVAGAALAESYTLQTETGSLLGLSAAAYNETAHTATLTLAQPPPEASITIAFPGITDHSREANPVAGTVNLAFTGPAAAVSPVPESGVPAAAWLVLTLAGVGILLGVVVAVVKKRGGLAVQEGKLHFGGAPPPPLEEELPAPEPGGRVHFVQGTLPRVRLEVTGLSGQSRRTDIPISGSLFVGRSDICDVVVDDPQMSRQHFVIEEQNGAYTLTNLSERGGTLLNGVPVQHPRPLQGGDAIEAGQERIVFWPLPPEETP